MTYAMTLIMAAVAIVALVTFAIIALFPRRIVPETFFCPEKKVLARIRLLLGNDGRGNLVVRDVVECSLFPGKPVTCQKRCIGRSPAEAKAA
jgi:hypothetical protein